MADVDSKTVRETDEHVIGLNCMDSGGGFLTFISDRSDQIWVSRADLEWLRDEGIPGWLQEMDDA